MWNITANLPSSKIRPEVEHGARRDPSFISVDGAAIAETETVEAPCVEVKEIAATPKTLLFHFLCENVRWVPDSYASFLHRRASRIKIRKKHIGNCN